MKKLLIALLFLPTLAFAQSAPFDITKGLTKSNFDQAFESKVNTTNGSATGLALTNGSASGTDISGANLSSDMTGAQAVTAITALQSATSGSTASVVLKSQIGVANGVAGLDDELNITANLLPNKAIIGADAFGDYLSNSFSGGYDPQRGYENDLLGGNQTYPDGTYKPRQVLQTTDPYGPYSAGCGYALNMMGSVYTPQSPVSEGVPTNGASAVVGVGGYDTVANCILWGNRPARLVLTVTGYTATSATLATPLTASQAAQIHPNMYITTNSPNTSLSPTNVTGELPKKNLYAGYVSASPSAGDTSISVFAWDVPGIGTGAANQVPQITTLDTVWSKYTSPVVFLGGGAAGSAFANNWYSSLNAPDLTPSSSNKSLIHQITVDEIDGPAIQNGTAPDNSVDYQGITMNAGNQPAALTTDSVQLLIGGNINHHIILNGGCGNWDYNSTSGGGFVDMPTPCGLSSDTTDQVMQEWTEWVSGANKMTMMLEMSMGNPTASTGWEQAVVHFGPTVDVTPVQTGDYGGSKQGDIEWNMDAQYGSISLCGFATHCGLRVNGDGTIAASSALTSSADISTSGQIKSTGGGLDIAGTAYFENGAVVYIKAATLANNLQAGWCAPNSYTMALCSNIGANVSLTASGDIRSTDGTNSGDFSTIGNLSGFHADGHGNWNTTTDTTDGGAFREASYTLATLPTTNQTDGNHLWCSDCTLNSVTGVEAYWHSSTSKWTDSQNGTLAN